MTTAALSRMPPFSREREAAKSGEVSREYLLGASLLKSLVRLENAQALSEELGREEEEAAGPAGARRGVSRKRTRLEVPTT